MKDAIETFGGALGTFVLLPILIYAVVGLASAVFRWASAQTTPLWHRYLLSLGLALFVLHMPT